MALAIAPSGPKVRPTSRGPCGASNLLKERDADGLVAVLAEKKLHVGVFGAVVARLPDRSASSLPMVTVRMEPLAGMVRRMKSACSTSTTLGEGVGHRAQRGGQRHGEQGHSVLLSELPDGMARMVE